MVRKSGELPVVNHLTIQLAEEWLDGTSKSVAGGFGPNGPNVQLERQDGGMALLELRGVAEELRRAIQENQQLKAEIEDDSLSWGRQVCDLDVEIGKLEVQLQAVIQENERLKAERQAIDDTHAVNRMYVAGLEEEMERMRQGLRDVLPNLLAWDASIEASESYLRLKELANEVSDDSQI